MGDEPLSDAVNDVGGTAGEPSYVSVAICIGANMDAQPVTLVDRLCLNRPAVQQIADNQAICIQQEVAFDREVERLTIQLDDSRHDNKVIAYGGIATYLLLVVVFTTILLGRK